MTMMKCFACTLLLCLSQGATAQSTFGELPQGNTETCMVDSDCPAINCFVAPCPANVCVEGSCRVEDNPPNPECVQDSDCPVVNCFAPPCDDNVCNAGLCELQPADGDNNNLVPGGGAARVEMSRQECTNEYDGIIVGDIGNGAIHSPDYVCESNGQAPIGTVVPGEGEPIASEGEVCCGAPQVEGISRQECTETHGGTIVGDIGDGAIHSPGYKCESNGEPPIAKVVPGEGEPIAMEGEVCCGPGVATTEEDTTTNTDTGKEPEPITTETDTTNTDASTPTPTSIPILEEEETPVSGGSKAVQSRVASVIVVVAMLSW